MSRSLFHKNLFAFVCISQAWLCGVRNMPGEYRILWVKGSPGDISIDPAFSLCIAYKYKRGYSAKIKLRTAGKRARYNKLLLSLSPNPEALLDIS